ncbi:MAG: IclR family transcriptional regulator [Oscillospiraceae bacterium]|nr:IclR family transcriptional regulator [Oscillospiraceae bacterium]
MDTIDNENRYILSSVDSALTILNLFLEYEELSANEIAKLIGVSRSTAFRFMVTLENRGFVTKTDAGKYRLGLNMFSLGMLAYNRMELVSLVHPLLTEMAQISGETCHASIIDDGRHVLFIDRVLGSSFLKMDTAIGYRLPAHCTATGKAILAYQSEQSVSGYIRRVDFTQVTSKSIKNAESLRVLLEEVRSRGYACDNEEAELGLTCYAVPLLDSSGHAYAAISISGPTTRMEANCEHHVKLLHSAVRKISRTIT